MSLPAPNPRQARIIWLALTGLAIALLVALLIALVWGLGQIIRVLSPVLWPLAVAGVLAYLLDPLVDSLERRNIPRTRAILCVFTLAAVILLALFSSVVPRIVVESRQLVQRVPAYVNQLQQKVEDRINNPPEILKRFLPPSTIPTNTASISVVTNGESQHVITNAPPQGSATNAPSVLQTALGSGNFQGAADWVAKALPSVGSWLFGQVGRVASWFGVLAGLALVPVYLFYFLLEKRGISSNWTDYLPVTTSTYKEEVVFVINSINNYLIAFFRGQVLVAICDGVLYTVGFLAIQLPYAVLLGALAVPLTMIPFLGAIITCVGALIIALIQYGDWLHPALVLGVFGVVQALEGTVISPKIMGDRVNLHPVTIIVAVMAGTTLLGGVLGGILAIPLTAALRVLMFRYVWRRPVNDGETQSEPVRKGAG